MPHPSKRKGNRFERELRDAFEAAGLRAERAFASDGRALTTDTGKRCTAKVDLLVEGGLCIQAKRRASVAAYMTCPVAEAAGGGVKVRVQTMLLGEEVPDRFYFEPPDGGEEQELTKEEYEALPRARHTLPENDPRHEQ